ncbi:FecR family protein [Hydromonas duriensis]|uniref:FecR family protein n=1 Tax=Hydromonas duriensis TaxID=1527608 RepID=A0A4R6Y7U8_9BURK|nr:FecR domain-containing protein [Hydromonas duriensis]TDR31438.1 FecR family protein [Hydromonas duriensis]
MSVRFKLKYRSIVLRALILGVLSCAALTGRAQEACDTSDPLVNIPRASEKSDAPAVKSANKKKPRVKKNRHAKAKRSPKVVSTAQTPKLISEVGQVVVSDAKGIPHRLFNTKGKAVPIQDGYTVQTGVQSFFSMGLSDGSRLVIPSNSTVLLKQITKTPILIDVKKGRVENYVGDSSLSNPKNKNKTSYRVRTPAVTLSVRGTKFGVEHDAASNITRTDVSEGVVAAQSPTLCGAPIILSHGKGAFASAQGIREYTMLPAPNLEQLPLVVRGKTLQLKVPEIAAARRYHFRVSYDEQFLLLVQESYSDIPAMELSGLDSGYYFVKVNGVDADGGEGLSSAVNILYQPDARPQ